MLVGTLTTIAAFVPMLIALDGGKSEYIYSLPVTVSTTLALSWLLAMTFCVILAGWFIRAPMDDRPASPLVALVKKTASHRPRRRKTNETTDPASGEGNVAFRVYNRLGMVAVRFKWLTTAIAGITAVAVMMLPVGSEFLSSSDT